jgi:DNA (cytosine-5)-methyltransferase 1
VLNAADFGVPQYRERVYIVAFDREQIRVPSFNWPIPNPEHVPIGPFIRSGVTDHSISRHLQEVYIRKREDGHPEVVSNETDHPVKTLVASYHKIQRITGTFVEDGPTGLRLLTADECKAIMGFPPTFRIPVSRTQMYRQMGNSVAVPVVEAIGREIVRALKDGTSKRPRSSRSTSKIRDLR